MKLGLGTVQFGCDYGISNQQGITPEAEVVRVLACAADHGLHLIDTASGYGVSEAVLGRCMPSQHGFRIVTKTPSFGNSDRAEDSGNRLLQAFTRSLDNLRTDACYALLAHDPNDLLSPAGSRMHEAMLQLRSEGRVQKIGVSVYTATQIDGILDRYALDIVQVPVSVFDQRFLRGRYLAGLKAAGIEIHARSAFLQGLLLMECEMLPERLAGAKTSLQEFRQACRHNGLTPVQAALGFVLGLAEVDQVICGVNNLRHLQDLIEVAPLDPEQFYRLAVDDERLLNPSCWG